MGPDGRSGSGTPCPQDSSETLAPSRPFRLSAGGPPGFDCRPPPLVWALTAGPGGALLARRLVQGGASSPMTAADPCLVGPWSVYGCQPPPQVLEPGDRPGMALLAYRTLVSHAGALAALRVRSACGTGVSPYRLTSRGRRFSSHAD